MNKYEVDEILNLAIMSKTPHIIVEGIDDIRIYEEIAKSAEADCEVYAVDMLDGFAGGNNGVIDAMSIMEGLPMPSGKSVKQFVAGVIDRDVRPYRNEMPEMESVFCLDVYSIESHFVSKFTIKPAIDRLTRVSNSENINVDEIYSSIERRIQDTYYFSLDALKSAIDPSYQSIIKYSSNIGRRKDKGTVENLQKRKEDLDQFAASLSLNNEISSLRSFVKGKWLLTAYSEELFDEIQLLTTHCKESRIQKCRMCELDNQAPCLYQLRDGMTKKNLYSTLRDFIEIPEFDYIKELFKRLESTAAA